MDGMRADAVFAGDPCESPGPLVQLNDSRGVLRRESQRPGINATLAQVLANGRTVLVEPLGQLVHGCATLIGGDERIKLARPKLTCCLP
jgi:hypothetical protein